MWKLPWNQTYELYYETMGDGNWIELGMNVWEKKGH